MALINKDNKMHRMHDSHRNHEKFDHKRKNNRSNVNRQLVNKVLGRIEPHDFILMNRDRLPSPLGNISRFDDAVSKALCGEDTLASRLKYSKSMGYDLTLFRQETTQLVSNYFGTQEPVFKLHSTATTATSSAGSILNTVVTASYSGLVDQSNWSLLFDEYQFSGNGIFRAYCTNGIVASTNLPIVVAVVDYASATALANADAGRAYDTSQFVYAAVTPPTVHAEESAARWSIKLQGIPDLTWTSTGSSLAVAYLKFYNYQGALGASTAYFMVEYDLHVRFRQVN